MPRSASVLSSDLRLEEVSAPGATAFRASWPLGLSLAAATAAWFWLPESLSAVENRVQRWIRSTVGGNRQGSRPRSQVLARRRLREPIGVFFLGTMGFAGFTTIFPLFLENPLGLTALYAGGMFALVGMVSAGVQGALIGPMVERYGEQSERGARREHFSRPA